MAAITFKLFHIDETLPAHYRLATINEVESHIYALIPAMPGREIADLANGTAYGAALGGRVSVAILPAPYKLAIHESSNASQFSQGPSAPQPSHNLTFKLFNRHDPLPKYRLATVQDVEEHRAAQLEAMPKWEIANLENGSVFGKLYGGHTRNDVRNDVAHKLAVLEGAVGPLSFKLFRVGDKLPHETRWATVEEVEANREALLEAMPKWEIANLANGSVHGALYGGRTSKEEQTNVAHKLAVTSI